MPREKDPYRLLVEGSDDKWSVINLMARHGVDWNNSSLPLPYIHDSKGIEQLLDSLEAAAKSYRTLGVLVDADLEPKDRWAQIKSRLEPLGISLPTTPSPEGVIVSGIHSSSRIGVWLMPDNKAPGMLEDFLLKLIPTGDPCWPYAEEVAMEAIRRGARCPQRHLAKASIYGWLAWQESPGLPFGTALTAKIFQDNSVEAINFVAWFKKLFL